MNKLNDIWNSWLEYAKVNLLLGFLLLCCVIAVFILYFSSKNGESNWLDKIKQQLLPISHIIKGILLISVLLICPLSALVIGKLQTVFYDYSLLWLAIPIIPMSAFFLTLIFDYFSKLERKAKIAAFILSIASLLLCGSLGISKSGATWFGNNYRGSINPLTTHFESYQDANPLLKRLSEISSSSYNDQLLVLAPASVTEYAHYYCSNIHTLYGKDMWDGAVTVYTYEQYSDDIKSLYKWMLYNDEVGCVYYHDSKDIMLGISEDTDYSILDNNPEYFGGIRSAKCAKDLGINLIVLYVNENTDYAGLSHIKEALSLSEEYVPIPERVNEGYILLYL